MKKILYFVVAATTMLSLASCNKSQSSSDSDSAEKPASFSLDGGNVQNNPKASEEDKTFSKNYGEGMGLGFAIGLAQNPNDQFDVDIFLKGLANVLAADTAKTSEQSYLIGANFGEEALSLMYKIEMMYNIHIDKEAFIAAVEKALKGPKPTDKQIEATNKKLADAFKDYQMSGPMGGGMAPGNQGAPMPQQPQQMPQQPQQAAPQQGPAPLAPPQK